MKLPWRRDPLTRRRRTQLALTRPDDVDAMRERQDELLLWDHTKTETTICAVCAVLHSYVDWHPMRAITVAGGYSLCGMHLHLWVSQAVTDDPDIGAMLAEHTTSEGNRVTLLYQEEKGLFALHLRSHEYRIDRLARDENWRGRL